MSNDRSSPRHRIVPPLAVFTMTALAAVALWRYAAAATAGRDSALPALVLVAGLLSALLLALATFLLLRALDQERALAATEATMKSIAENVPVLVAVHDVELREVSYVNPRFEDIYGLPADTLLEDPDSFLTLVHPADREAVAAAIASDLPAGTFDQEYRIVHRDGAVRWVRARSALAPGATGARRVVTVAEDVTDRRHAQAELRRSNEDLQQFAYVASHDLQEPLRMVSSYLELIDRRYGDRLDDRGHEFLEFALDGSRRMKRLIDGLLQYSRVETRAEEHETVDVEGILDAALANLRAPIEEANATIRREPLPEIVADPRQITTVFQNLISNALKFREAEPPRVEISVVERPASWEFSVRDHGVGFDPAHSDQLFVLFRRLHGRRDFPGTGIGLALCRRIVERHGGRIWAESRLGVGSTFSFTLPKRPEVSS